MHEEMEQIFERRNKDFEIRERTLEEKKKELGDVLSKIKNEQITLNAEKKALEEQIKIIAREKEELAESLRGLESKKQEVIESKMDIDKVHAELVIKEKIKIEELQNERIALKKEREAFEYERMTNGILSFPSEKKESEEIPTLKKSLQEEQQKRGELEAQIAKQRINTMDLVKQIVELKKERETPKSIVKEAPVLKEPVEEKVNVEEKPEAISKEVIKDDGIQQEEIKEETIEELTAEVLQSFLLKNCTEEWQEIEVLHTEKEDQLSMNKDGLHFRFVFDQPSYFDISAQRKNSRKLRKTLEVLNKEHPQLKFAYVDDCAVVTGYFMKELPTYVLMDEVRKILELFN